MQSRLANKPQQATSPQAGSRLSSKDVGRARHLVRSDEDPSTGEQRLLRILLWFMLLVFVPVLVVVVWRNLSVAEPMATSR